MKNKNLKSYSIVFFSVLFLVFLPRLLKNDVNGQQEQEKDLKLNEISVQSVDKQESSKRQDILQFDLGQQNQDNNQESMTIVHEQQVQVDVQDFIRISKDKQTQSVEEDNEEKKNVQIEEDEKEIASSVSEGESIGVKIGLNNAEKALQLLNHFSTVLYRITDSLDLRLLELEYDRINRDNIFLDVIEDSETISIIQQIMNYITELRINDKERELLHEWLQEDLRNAVFETCPDPTGLITWNPRVIAHVTAQFAFSWFFHYMGQRKKLLREFTKQNWELDKTKAEFLNQLNTELLEKTWTLVKRYDIHDAYRITIPEIKEFVKYVDGETNENRVYDFLCLNEEKYKKFPEFWYRRGRSAETLGNRKDAMSSYKKYQDIYLQFLRKDRMAADVALNLAKLMIEEGKYEKKDMLKQLKIIEENVYRDDWSYLYFCGRTYLDLNENENARKVLGNAVIEMENSLSKKHDAFIEKLKKKEKIKYLDNIPPYSYPLIMCRIAYFEACSKVFSTRELGKKFSDLCEDKLTSGFEQILYCNENSKLTQNLPINLLNELYMTVAHPDGYLYFHAPMNWFYQGNEKMTIEQKMKDKEKIRRSFPCLLMVHYVTDEIETFEEKLDKRMFKYNNEEETNEEHYLAKIEFPYKYKWIKNKEVKFIEFSFPLRGLSVTLVYIPKSEEEQLFPEEEKNYSPSVIKINGKEIPITTGNMSSYEKIGESIKAFYKH